MKNARFFIGMIHLQTCLIVWNSVRKLANDIPKKNFRTFYVIIVSWSYDKLKIILQPIERYIAEIFQGV